MDYRELIDEITRLVMLELEKQERASVSISSGAIRKVLIPVDSEMNDFSPLMEVLYREPPGTSSYVFVASSEVKETLTEATAGISRVFHWDPSGNSYGMILRDIGRVVIPHVSVTSLQKMANLIGDEPVPGIFLNAVLLGIPVALCTDYIHSLKFKDRALPKKLTGMLDSSLSILEEMGVSLIQLAKINAPVESALSVDISGGVKNVITNDDVLVAASQNKKILNFPRGTIVTPLAWETAKIMEVTINLV